MMHSRSENSVLFFIAIAGFCFYIFNLFTPEVLDDFSYKFCYVDSSFNTERPVRDLSDILISQYNHYLNYHGRIVVHFFVQLFSAIIGKAFFNVINTAVFCGLLYGLMIYCCPDRKNSLLTLSVAVLLIFSTLQFNECFLWMTGSLNYMWVFCITIFYLIAIEKLSNKAYVRKSILLFIPGLLAGWTHEGVTFPLALASIVYLISRRHIVLKSMALPLILGFVVGAFCCAFSPGTISRFGSGCGSSFLSTILGKIVAGFTLCSKIRIFYILLLLFAIEKFALKKSILGLIHDNEILLWGILFSFGIVFFSGFITLRTAFGTEIFSLLVLLRLIPTFNLIERKRKFLAYAFVSLNIFAYILVMPFLWRNYQEYKSLIAQIEKGGSYIIQTEKVDYPTIMEKIICRPIDDYNNRFSTKNFWNICMSATYGRDSLAFVPSAFIRSISENPEKHTEFSSDEKWPFYAKKLDGYRDVTNVTLHLRKTEKNEIPCVMRPFAERMQRYSALEISEDRFSVLKVDGDFYLLVKKNEMVDNRLAYITYQ